MVSGPSVCAALYRAKSNLCMRDAIYKRSWYSLESAVMMLNKNRGKTCWPTPWKCPPT